MEKREANFGTVLFQEDKKYELKNKIFSQ